MPSIKPTGVYYQETMLDDEEMKEALADAESYSYQEEKGGKA